MSIDKKYFKPYPDEMSYLVAWFNRWYPDAPNPADVASADEYLATLTPFPALAVVPRGQLRAWALACARPRAQPIAIAMGDVDP